MVKAVDDKKSQMMVEPMNAMSSEATYKAMNMTSSKVADEATNELSTSKAVDVIPSEAADMMLSNAHIQCHMDFMKCHIQCQASIQRFRHLFMISLA